MDTNCFLLLAVSCTLTTLTGVSSVSDMAIKTSVEKLVAWDGEEAQLSCSSDVEALGCTFTTPSGVPYQVQKGSKFENERIAQTELSPKDCAIKITNILDIDHGKWKCSITGKGQNEELMIGSGLIEVNVVTPPTDFRLEMDGRQVTRPIRLNLNQGKQVSVSCIGSGSRLDFDFQWFIGTTLLETNIDERKEENESGKLTYMSTLEYNADPKHNGQILKCELSLFGDIMMAYGAKLSLQYPPEEKPTETFHGMEEGQANTIQFNFKANPKPLDGSWIISETVVPIGSISEDNKFESSQFVDGELPDEYFVELTFTMEPELADETFALEVTNEIGSTTYEFKLVPLQDKNCTLIDDLGLLWKGKHGKTVVRDCSETSSLQEGTQSWTCENGDFTTEFPDRRNCTDKWLPDLNQKVESKDTTSYEDSVLLEDNLDEAGETGVTEDALSKLVVTMNNMLTKRKGELNNETKIIEKNQDDFYTSYMKNIDTLLGSKTFKWINSSNGYELNFGYINNSIELGKLVTSNSNDSSNLKFEFEGTLVKSQAIFNPDHDKDIVFSNNKTTITIKKEKLPEKVHHANGIITSYQDLTNRFPQTFNGSNATLWNSMVDYTLLGNITDDIELDVELEFNHDRQQEPPKCVFWDPENQEWKDDGCKVVIKNSCKTKCFCDHLTNFGLLFGGGLTNDLHDFAKDLASKIFCGLSIALQIYTQVVLIKERNIKISKQRMLVELNRNCCLILALICFVFLSDVLAIRKSASACTAMTFLNHYLWLATFFWILIEGYLLYNALVVVFDKSHHKLYPLFMLGYGAPLVIASLTVTIASTMFTDEDTNCNTYSNPDICHLGEPYIYYALAVPVSLILVINGCVFIRCSISLKKSTERKHQDKKQILKVWLRGCIILSFLLSLFWIITIMAGMPFLPVAVRHTFHYLAIGFNGSIGLFTFLNKSKDCSKSNKNGETKSTRKPMKAFQMIRRRAHLGASSPGESATFELSSQAIQSQEANEPQFLRQRQLAFWRRIGIRLVGLADERL